MIQKLTSRNLLEDKEELVRLLKVLDQLDDVLVPLAVVEKVDLFEDPGPAVAGDLVDDLDGILHLGVHVEASLDRGVSPLTKNFSC